MNTADQAEETIHTPMSQPEVRLRAGQLKILKWVIDQGRKKATISLEIEARARSCGELRNAR